jgi:hypothetical protein
MAHSKCKQSNKARSNRASTNTEAQTGMRRACAASEISLRKWKKSTVTVAQDVDESEDNTEEHDVCGDDDACEEDDERELGTVVITIKTCQLLTRRRADDEEVDLTYIHMPSIIWYLKLVMLRGGAIMLFSVVVRAAHLCVSASSTRGI